MASYTLVKAATEPAEFDLSNYVLPETCNFQVDFAVIVNNLNLGNAHLENMARGPLRL